MRRFAFCQVKIIIEFLDSWGIESNDFGRRVFVNERPNKDEQTPLTKTGAPHSLRMSRSDFAWLRL